jgi:predicted permease
MKRLLYTLVRLYPAAFRDRFAAEIEQQIREDHARANLRGPLALFTYSLGTGWDIARSALAEHINPTWTQVAPPLVEDAEMQSSWQLWMRDLRLAMRSLRRSPGFALVTIGTLGLAIGVNAGMFSVVNKVLLQPLPYPNHERLVHIAASAPGSGFPDEFGVSNEFYVHYKERSTLVEEISTYNSATSTFRTDDRVERIRMSFPTNSFYRVLGGKPMLGRLPVPEDEDRVVVISNALWQTWFGGDSSVVGKSYFVSGAMRTIVGIMPPEFNFPEGTLLWVAGEIRPTGITPGRFQSPLIARLKPGVTPEALANELTTLSKQLPERFGGTPNYAKIISQHRAVVRPVTEQMLGPAADPLWVLLGAVGIVLLIACANVANLFVVRAESRQRDLAVRRALGAARGRLIQSLMSEAVIVAAAAAVLAVALAAVSLPAFVQAAPQGMPRLGDVKLDGSTILFTLGAAALAALACGLLPAIKFSAADFARLRESSRGSTRGHNWVRDGLVVGQTALALVLLIGSGLLVRSFEALRSVDAGYVQDDVFTFQFAPDNPNLRDGPTWARYHHAMMDRLRALPGVETVGLVENMPLNEGTGETRFVTEKSAGETDGGAVLNLTWAAGDYYKAMGMRVIQGRVFEERDHLVTPGSVVISETSARLLFNGEDPIGKRMKSVNDSTWHTVIGVVNDVMQDGFRESPEAIVYFPLVGPTPTSWMIGTPAYIVKTKRAETIAPEIRAIVKEVAPNAPMYRTFTLKELARNSVAQLSFTMLTLGIVSTLALILGAVGLYGVLSYVVAQRTREIGVRMALGAGARQVQRMVVFQGARVVFIGVAIGIAVALASTKALGTLLFGVAPLDLMTFVAMSLSMIAVGMLASYVPARRASQVDPIESLRGD